MFVSITPRSILLLKTLAKEAAETFLPGNKSSANNLKESPRLTLPPINPLAKAKKDAVDTFLICVIGEKTVLPIWPVALTDIKALYKGMSYRDANDWSTPLIAFAISGVVSRPPWSSADVNNLLSNSCPNLLPDSFDTWIKLFVLTPFARASSIDLKNKPDSKPVSANLSKKFLA